MKASSTTKGLLSDVKNGRASTTFGSNGQGFRVDGYMPYQLIQWAQDELSGKKVKAVVYITMPIDRVLITARIPSRVESSKIL